MDGLSEAISTCFFFLNLGAKQSGLNLDGSEGNQLHFYTCLQLIEAIIRPIALIKEFIALHCVQENFRHIYEMYLAHVHSSFGRFEKGEQVESVAQGLVGVAGEMSPAAKQRRHHREMALYCNCIRITSFKNG